MPGDWIDSWEHSAYWKLSAQHPGRCAAKEGTPDYLEKAHGNVKGLSSF